MVAIKFNASQMAEHCKVFGKVINCKASTPIMECVKFSKGARIALTASNGEEYITTSLPKSCGTLETDVCIPYKWLKELCDNNPSATISLHIGDKQTLTAQTIDGETKGKYFSATEYPSMHAEHCETSYNLNGEELLDAIAKVEFARATDTTRLMMTGIYLDGQEDGSVNVVATDGRAMAIKTIYATEADGLHMAITKKVADMLGAMKSHDLAINGYEDYYYRAFANGYCLEFKAIEGRYPNYKAVVIDTNKAERGLCSRHGLIATLKRMSAFGNMSSTLCEMTFATELEGGLRVESHDYDRDTSVCESLPCFTTHSAQLQIGVSSLIANNVLSRLTGNTVAIYTLDPSRPLVFVGADESLYTLLMPMQIDDIKPEEPTELEAEGVNEECITEITED